MNYRKGLSFTLLVALLIAIRLIAVTAEPMKKPSIKMLKGTKDFEGKPVGPLDFTINVVDKKFEPPSSFDLSQFPKSGPYVKAIVQFKGPIQEQWIKEISSMNVKIESYIPNFALLLSVPSDKLEALANKPYVRWMGPYTEEYKEGPLVKKMSLQAGKPVTLLVKGFSTSDVESLKAEIEAKGGKVIRTLPFNVLMVSIDGGKVPELKGIESVMVFDVMKTKTYYGPPKELRGRFYDLNLTRNEAPKPNSYFANMLTGVHFFTLLTGLNGAGEVIAIGDTGLDTGDALGVDDDGDGLVDEDGPDGTWVNNDGDYFINEDPQDDDGDGLVDEDPVNGVDDDGDFYVDEDPAQGVDEDSDGLVDEDPINGADDDGDGLVDEDPAGIDNDWDGLVDEDPVELGVDNDGDGLVDEDPAGIDNDGDGLVNEDPYDDDGDGRLNEDPMNYGDNDGDGNTDEDGMSDDASCGLPDLDGDRFWWYDNDDGDFFIDEDGITPGVDGYPGVDDDGDGLVDEDPAGCDNDGDGLVNEDPAPGEDDDGDGIADEDPIPYFDEDNDGLVDEDPINGADDDGDGLVDEDPKGIDNDGDGLVDEDTEIWPDFVGKIVAAYDATELYSSDGAFEDFHYHGTHVAGTAAGYGLSSLGKYGGAGAKAFFPPVTGAAQGAKIAVVRLFGDLTRWEVNYLYTDEWSAFARVMRASGAKILSNSWGYPAAGEYSLYEALWDAFVKGGTDWDGDSLPEPSVTVVFAAGNEGPGPTTIGGPATAKNVITVGSTRNVWFGLDPTTVSDFSSRGPTADGRIKPDVCAPGEYVMNDFTGMYYYGWYLPEPIQRYHIWLAGTSMATPQVAGIAAIVRQAFKLLYGVDLQPPTVKAILVASSDWMGRDPTADSDGNGVPDIYDYGFGKVDMIYFLNYLASINSGLAVCDECLELSTNWTANFEITVEDSSMPLRVAIAWNDPPQWVPSEKALVNDFDLIVIAPDGTEYHGNDFTAPYNDYTDHVNNVELVHINNPTPGTYKIKVFAYNMVGDPPFSLSVAGSISGTNIGVGNFIGLPNVYVGGVAEVDTATIVAVILLLLMAAVAIYLVRKS